MRTKRPTNKSGNLAKDSLKRERCMPNPRLNTVSMPYTKLYLHQSCRR